MADAAADDADSLKMKLLEARLHHLESIKQHKQNYFGDCCPCLTLVINWLLFILQSIPYFSILAFVPTLIGAWYIYKNETIVRSFLSTLAPTAGVATHNVPYGLVLVLLVDLISVLAAFPSTGPLRVTCFRRAHRGCLGFFQNIAGAGTLFGLLILLQLCFLAFFASVLFSLPGVTMLLLTWGACKNGTDEAKQGLATALANMVSDGASSIGTYSAASLVAIDKVCADKYDEALAAASFLALGVALVTVGQVLQAALTVNGLTKIKNTPQVPEWA